MCAVSKKTRGCKLPNALATMVMSGAVGLAYFNCDPMIAGSEPTQRMANLDIQPVMALPPLPQAPVPAPVEPGAEPVDGAPESQTVAAYDDGVLRGKWALQMNTLMLQRGVERFRDIDSYKFTLTRQERVGGDLLPPQVMDVKLRHAPFSLYMKWLAGEGAGVKGRQLLFVEGQNDDKLIILPGGLAGRLTGALELSLDDPLVTAEARHPANECGLLRLAETVLGHHVKDLEHGCHGVQCEFHDNQVFNERPCYLFMATYESPERSPTYRKVAMYIDKELSMPICINNYTWGNDIPPEELDQLTLVEAYSYSDITIDTREASLTEDDWNRDNSKYRMRKKK
ncbi:MAG: DUF1571 domain-containing protein [Planctomycetaceae bacterium]|nr:DUF1571 domain-containing protein [Planctomycetaceae bacterium]